MTVEALENGLSDERRMQSTGSHGRRPRGDDRLRRQGGEDRGRRVRKMFASEFEEILDENPLLDSFEPALTAASADKELLDGFIAGISKIAGSNG